MPLFSAVRFSKVLSSVGFGLALALWSGGERTANAISNGLETQSFPTVGAVLHSGGIRCSGVLVGCETFLTTANCVSHVTTSNLSVYLQHAGVFPVASATPHPDYDFPAANIAVLKLATPVTGIAPTPLNTLDPTDFIPAPGTFVGFGETFDGRDDEGLKRFGAVETSLCQAGSDEEHLCWEFEEPLGPAGSDSNTCRFGDSGAPLFMDLGAGGVVAATSFSGRCNPGDPSNRASNLATYLDFIVAEGGADLEDPSCSGPAVGDASVSVVERTGSLSAANPEALYRIGVTPGATRMIVTMNSTRRDGEIFNLHVKHGSPATPNDFDCASEVSRQFESCVIDNPAAGDWFILVDRWEGNAPFQLTATIHDAAPAVCGDESSELAEECDGASDANCPGACTSDCTCQTEIDDFMCYSTRKSRGSPRFERSQVGISDEIESGQFDVRGPAALCTPADGAGDGIDDPDTHLEGYHIKPAAGLKHVAQKELRVKTRFFEHHLDTRRAERLLVPAALDPASPPLAPELSSHFLDHYKCYQVRDSRGFPRMPRGIQAQVSDAFENRRYDLKRAMRLCLPGDQDGLGIKHPEKAILCYQAKKASGETHHTRQVGLHSADAIATLQQDTKKEESLCVAAEVIKPQPDECSTAPEITSFPSTHLLNVQTATTSFDDPFASCVYEQGENSVFYRYTAPADGVLSVDTFGSDYEAGLAVFNGGCGDLQEIACNDYAGDRGDAQLGVGVHAGETYTIEVTSEFGLYEEDNEGHLRLNFDFLPCGGNCNRNDECSDAIPIAKFPFEDRRVVSNATYNPVDDAEVCGSGEDRGTVWYKVTAPVDGYIWIDTAGSDYDTVGTALNGTCGDLDAFYCDGSQDEPFLAIQTIVDFDVVGGVPVYVAISEDREANGGGILDLVAHFTPETCGDYNLDPGETCDIDADAACPGRCTSNCTCAPGFDSCMDAIEIDGFPFSHVTDTSLATNAPDDPRPTCGAGTRSVWYSVTPEVGGKLILDSFVSEFDSVISVYPGNCGEFTRDDEIVCNDWAADPYAYLGAVEFDAEAGQTYSVQVSHYESYGSGNHLEFNAALDLCGNGVLDSPNEQCENGNDAACPGFCSEDCQCISGNDACATAHPVTTFPFREILDVSNTTSSFDDPVLSCAYGESNRPRWGYNSVWYAVTPPIDGTLLIDAAGANYSVDLAVHTGTCNNLEELLCEDESTHELPVTAGETLYLEVTADYENEDQNRRVLSLDLIFDSCGDGILDPGEECEVGSDDSCPGFCSEDCRCISGNDACVAARPVNSFPFAETLNVTSATSSFDDPVLSCAAGNSNRPQWGFNSVWYAITPPTSGTLLVDTSGTNYAVDSSLHSGACGELEEQLCDPFPPTDFPVTAGETVYLEVTADQKGNGFSRVLSLDLDLDVCGNGIMDPGEACDGADDAACPGYCDTACTCAALPDDPDECLSAPELSTHVRNYRFPSLAQSGQSPSDPTLSCSPTDFRTTWYRFTPDSDGEFVAIANQNANNTSRMVLAAHRGACSQLEELDCSLEPADYTSAAIRFDVEAGQNYWLELAVTRQSHVSTDLEAYFVPNTCGNGVIDADERCDGAASPSCPGSCNSDCQCATGALDTCQRAEVIDAFPYNDWIQTTHYSSDPDDPELSCGDPTQLRGGHTAWYQFTAPSDGTLRANTFEGKNRTTIDTVLAAHVGSCASKSEVACSDDLDTPRSEVELPVNAGETYFLEIASRGNTVGGRAVLHANFEADSCGNGVLEAGEACDASDDAACPGTCTSQCQCAVAGDECVAAFRVDTFPFSAANSTINETSAPDDPPLSCGLALRPQGSHTLWYEMIAPREGVLTLRFGTFFNGRWAAHSGTCGALTEVACTFGQNSIDIPVLGGETYYAELTSYGTTDGNHAGVSITFEACGDDIGIPCAAP